MGKEKDAVLYESSSSICYSIEGNVTKARNNLKNKKTKSENVHAGHRDRLRERFKNEGLENFQDHNILELLLFYSIPVKDTNEEAHRLMDTFGSLSDVFDASFDELCNVKGIGERTSLLIKLMPALFNKYETDKINKDVVMINSAKLVAEYASKFFKGITFEKLYAMYLDKNCKLLGFECVGNGNENLSPVNNRMIIEQAYLKHASSVILIHNHPSGVMAPSKKDIDTTIAVANILETVGMRLDDHVIIGHGNDFFSFRLSKKWNGIFK